jgi:hypothetical protein
MYQSTTTMLFSHPKNGASGVRGTSSSAHLYSKFLSSFSEVPMCIKKINKEIKKILVKLLAMPATVTFQKCDTEPSKKRYGKRRPNRSFPLAPNKHLREYPVSEGPKLLLYPKSKRYI